MKVRLSDTALFENQADERLREREIGITQADFRPKSQILSNLSLRSVLCVVCIKKNIQDGYKIRD